MHSVRPDDGSFATVQLKSQALINGDLIGLTGGDMDIDVETIGECHRLRISSIKTYS